MSDELKAATETVAWIEHNRHTSVQWDLDAFQEFYERDIDALLPLARAYLADLAAREAEERERLLPIDREWLRLQGQDIGMDILAGGLSLIVADLTWSKVFAWKSHVDPNQEWFIKTCTTRGEVMDLIAMFPADAAGE